MFPELVLPCMEHSMEVDPVSGEPVLYTSVRVIEKQALSLFTSLSKEALALPPLQSVDCTQGECQLLDELYKNQLNSAWCGAEPFVHGVEKRVQYNDFLRFFNVLKSTAPANTNIANPLYNTNINIQTSPLIGGVAPSHPRQMRMHQPPQPIVMNGGMVQPNQQHLINNLNPQINAYHPHMALNGGNVVTQHPMTMSHQQQHQQNQYYNQILLQQQQQQQLHPRQVSLIAL
jgi:hypothetical protein